jgi:phage baseplate assembly protein W
MAEQIVSKGKNVARKYFADLDLKFASNPVTRDVNVKYDSDAIRRAVKNLVLTDNFERPFKPGIGANIRGLLFELQGDDLTEEIELRVTELLNNFEPRITNVQVEVSEDTLDSNDLNVTIYYTIKNDPRPQTLDIVVNRIR